MGGDSTYACLWFHHLPRPCVYNSNMGIADNICITWLWELVSCVNRDCSCSSRRVDTCGWFVSMFPQWRGICCNHMSHVCCVSTAHGCRSVCVTPNLFLSEYSVFLWLGRVPLHSACTKLVLTSNLLLCYFLHCSRERNNELLLGVGHCCWSSYCPCNKIKHNHHSSTSFHKE